LGANVARALGRELLLWPGFCPTHMRISKAMINERKKEFPNALVMVHPECEPGVVEMADVSLSTGGMLKFAKETSAKQIIVGTELGIIHRLKKENPDKIFIPVSEQAICPNMKLIELPDVLRCLENMETEIVLDTDTISKAKASIEKMIELS
jgi:quinolinate synthase